MKYIKKETIWLTWKLLLWCFKDMAPGQQSNLVFTFEKKKQWKQQSNNNGNGFTECVNLKQDFTPDLKVTH